MLVVQDKIDGYVEQYKQATWAPLLATIKQDLASSAAHPAAKVRQRPRAGAGLPLHALLAL